MKTLSYFIISFCLTIVLLGSCSSRKPVEPLVATKEVIKEITKRDTLIIIKKDSAKTVVRIECPNGDIPLIKKTINTQNGNHLTAPTITLKGNTLEAQVVKRAGEIKVQLTDKTTKEIITKPHFIYIEKAFKWYHKTLMWLGGVSALLLIAVLILLLIKKTLKNG